MNIKTILQGIGIWIAAVFASILLNYIIPPIITAGETFYTNTDIQAIAWLFYILVNIIGILVIPNYFIIRGIQDETTQTEKLPSIIIAILLFFFTVLLTYKGWYMITALASIITSNFALAAYWIGLIIMWLEFLVIIPVILITKAYQK